MTFINDCFMFMTRLSTMELFEMHFYLFSGDVPDVKCGPFNCTCSENIPLVNTTTFTHFVYKSILM